MKSLFKKISTAFVAVASVALMAGGMIALPANAASDTSGQAGSVHRYSPKPEAEPRL